LRHQKKLALFFPVFVFIGLLSATARLGPGRLFDRGTAQAAAQAVRFEIPAGWTVFRGKSGLIVTHPVGWKVLERGDGGFVSFCPGPDGGATAVVYVQPIAKIEGRAVGVAQELGRIAPDLFPGAQAGKTRIVSERPEVAVAEFSYTPKATRFVGVAMCFKEDPRGVLYAMAASPAAWSQAEPVMKQILGRFFYSGGGQAQESGGALPTMVMWRDPVEGAFTCPVPQGWKIEGGLRRFSLGDTRPEILAVSPDNRILVRIGDASIPGMDMPTQMGMQMGLGEGAWQTSWDGSKRLIMRYLPAASFLTEFYLPRRVGQISNVKTEELPQIAQALMAQSAGLPVRYDAAGLNFDAQTENGFRKGGAVAITMLYVGDASLGVGTWNVTQMAGYLADPEVETQAQAILGRMIKAYQMDPGWSQRNNQAMMQGHQASRQAQQDTFNIINQAYADRSRSQDRVNENWSRAFRGEVLIQDPATGQTFEVASGSNYYFRVGTDNRFVGTETADSPNLPNHWLTEMRIVD